VLEWVREWYRDFRYRYSFDYMSASGAATNGNLCVLRWAEANGALRTEDFEKGYVFQGAAKNGHLDVLRWAHARGMLFDPVLALCSEAARNGKLRVVEWALKNGFALGAVACEKAAESGDLVVLKRVVGEDGRNWNRWTWAKAARSGKLEMLKWVRAQGCP
jgi:hypothetical protein